ncbi:hypothetical protein [Roseivirga pacifica]|uniref:hypothetical protein n=1 Tax=Roseivirga pacifica TaxID=1267423 RepID=UPI00227BDD17|nr:hypothetical protein [Roseivirga pacifica]
MKRPQLLIALVACCLFFAGQTLSAQESLNENFSKLLDESESYQDYKVIRTSKLVQFKSAMLDSLFEYNKSIASLESEVNSLKSDLETLKSDYATIAASLNESEARNGQIGVLGLNIEKSAYNIVVWSFVGFFAIIATILYFRIKHVCAVVKRVKAAYSKIMEEYRHQRFQATEKQMKLKRELQTVQNKLDMMQASEETTFAR